MVWDNIEWKYSFSKIVREGKNLVVIKGLKVRIPIIPRCRAFRKRHREELMKDNPYAALDRCRYENSLFDYGELEEEIYKREG